MRRGDSNTRRDGRGAPKDSGSGGSSVAAADRPTGGELGQEGRVARDAPRRHCGYKAGTQRQVDYSIVEGRRFAIAGIRTREPVGAGSN